MPHTLEQKDHKAILTLTIPQVEVEEGMKKAAEQFSDTSNIPGFRPGKASYEVIKQRVGEMKLLEAAAEELIRAAFVKAMLEEDLETVGQPYFSVEKLAPGNDLVIRAEIALYPHVKKLADFRTLSVKANETKPSQKMIDEAKHDLAVMQTKEIRRSAGEMLQKGDKAVIDLTLKKDGVVLEGGEGRSHGVYTGEGHYIAGMVDQLVGMKEGEEKAFTLPFPKDHYQKHLAGQDVEIEVKVKEIFALEAPKIDDAFAKAVGLKDLAELDAKLAENLALENEKEEIMRQEKEMLELLADKSDFEEIPDLLVNQEVNQMLHELEHQVEEKGAKFDEYLASIKKSVADLKLDFTPTALKRVKIAILLKELAKAESIEVTEEELDSQVDQMAARYEGDEETQKRIYDPRYREYAEQQLRNKKTIDFVKSFMVK